MKLNEQNRLILGTVLIGTGWIGRWSSMPNMFKVAMILATVIAILPIAKTAISSLRYRIIGIDLVEFGVGPEGLHLDLLAEFDGEVAHQALELAEGRADRQHADVEGGVAQLVGEALDLLGDGDEAALAEQFVPLGFTPPVCCALERHAPESVQVAGAPGLQLRLVRQVLIMAAAANTKVEAAGLDPLWRVRLREVVLELRASGRTVLIASHDLAEPDAALRQRRGVRPVLRLGVLGERQEGAGGPHHGHEGRPRGEVVGARHRVVADEEPGPVGLRHAGREELEAAAPGDPPEEARGEGREAAGGDVQLMTAGT